MISVRCKFCGVMLPQKRGTTTGMRMHVRIWHPDELVTRPDGETISVTELFGESGFPARLSLTLWLIWASFMAT